jgi:5-formyltetrahydrofolate cyclo-ligase
MSDPPNLPPSGSPPHGADASPSGLPPEDYIRRRVKAEIRKRMRGLRSTLPADACAKRSAAILERLEAHPALQAARRVALFWPIEARHEVDLRPLDAALRARGVSVAYPAIDPETRVMDFRSGFDPSVMEEQGMGFREPPPGATVAARGDLDVVIVPALAVDPRGHRIGYGAGFYDRALPLYAPPAITIAVAFDFQLVAEVAQTEGDVPVQFVVTDTRTLTAEP